jgi:hypothetical protein
VALPPHAEGTNILFWLKKFNTVSSLVTGIFTLEFRVIIFSVAPPK